MQDKWDALLPAAQREEAVFLDALRSPREAQLGLLKRILANNGGAEYGRAHGFYSITNFAEYHRRVPISSYEYFRPSIDRIANGETNILTSDAVIAFEETGGTATGGKLIPYTAASLVGFRRAILPWLARLARRRPGVTQGRAYVTISPATRPARCTASGIAVGLASDAAYLGDELATTFASLLAVPPSLAGITDVASWQMASLRALVAADDLSFISLWSPTFLSVLLASLPAHAEAVFAGLDPPDRARLDRAMSGNMLDTQRLWPRLDCISCWMDGPSAGFAAQLAALFPHAVLDPKGLLATEGAITVPFAANGYCMPALTSCVIEFLDGSGEARLCDELTVGERYELVITTEGGLYRYAIGDLVQCIGHDRAVPLLRFVGRSGRISDLVGEKLTEAFVAEILSALGLAAVLAASTEPTGYVLMLEGTETDDSAALGLQVEQGLCRNPQYAHALRIGQIAPLRVIACAGVTAAAFKKGIASGRRMGDVKPLALIPLETKGE